MEHPCHQCGAAVDDGVPFCKNCGAPQIRVAHAPPEEAPAGPSLPPGTPNNIQPPAQPVPLPALPHAVDWRLGLGAAAVGGLAAAVASLIPVVSLGCCLWMLGGGALAVSFYHRRRPASDVTSGMGARLGAVTGVLGFFIFAGLTAVRLFVEVVVLHMGAQIRSEMRQIMEQSAARNPDPQVQAMMQWMTSPQGFATFVTLGMLLFFMAFVVFCSAGGALGASLFGRRARD